MAEDKRDAERKYREALSRYQTVSSRTGSRLNLRQSESRYSSASDEIGRLMALGLYADAMREISNVDDLSNRMEQEYNQVLQAEEAERQSTQSSSSTQSSGGSSWDFGSSESSSSSDSGNSSGGSNW